MNSNQTEQFICESVFWVKVIDSTTHSQWYNESSSQARICLPVMFESKRVKNGWVITSSELKCLRNWRVETAPKILKLNSDWKEQLHRIEPITTSIFHWNQFDTQSNSFPVMSRISFRYPRRRFGLKGSDNTKRIIAKSQNWYNALNLKLKPMVRFSIWYSFYSNWFKRFFVFSL